MIPKMNFHSAIKHTKDKEKGSKIGNSNQLKQAPVRGEQKRTLKGTCRCRYSNITPKVTYPVFTLFGNER